MGEGIALFAQLGVSTCNTSCMADIAGKPEDGVAERELPAAVPAHAAVCAAHQRAQITHQWLP